MDAFVEFLINNGYWGFLIASFIAGSFLPFSSEAVMVGLMAAGLKPWPLVIYGTIGNWAGSMFNYMVGHMGKMEWISKYLHVKEQSLERARRFMGDKGAWMGFFSFLPVLGTAICIILGLMRARLSVSAISIFLGKFLRYVIVMFGSNLLLSYTAMRMSEYISCL